MQIILFLIPIALLLGIFFLIGFIWAVRSGQYDDLDTPQVRVLFDQKSVQIPKKKDKGGL